MHRILRQSVFFLLLSMGSLSGAGLDSLLERSPFVPNGMRSGGKDPKVSGDKEPGLLADRFEIRGVFSQAGKQMVSVWLKEEERAVWVTVGEEMYPGFPVFGEFDSIDQTLWVALDGKRERLSLAKADYSQASAASVKPIARVIDASSRVQGNVQNVKSERVPLSRQLDGIPGSSVNGQRTVSRTGGRVLPQTQVPNRPRSVSNRVASGGFPRRLSSAMPVPGVDNISTEQTNSQSDVSVRSSNQNTTTPQGTTQSRSAVQPQVPTPPQPIEIPQLPKGFDAEAYLRDQSEKNQ